MAQFESATPQTLVSSPLVVLQIPLRAITAQRQASVSRLRPAEHHHNDENHRGADGREESGVDPAARMGNPCLGLVLSSSHKPPPIVVRRRVLDGAPVIARGIRTHASNHEGAGTAIGVEAAADRARTAVIQLAVPGLGFTEHHPSRACSTVRRKSSSLRVPIT
jgi:hypothetical protein